LFAARGSATKTSSRQPQTGSAKQRRGTFGSLDYSSASCLSPLPPSCLNLSSAYINGDQMSDVITTSGAGVVIIPPSISDGMSLTSSMIADKVKRLNADYCARNSWPRASARF